MNKSEGHRSVALVMAGCGEWDGTQIHEAVLTMLALDREGATIVRAAPDMDQIHVLNHMRLEEMAESRNVLVESARLAGGNIVDLSTVSARDLDAVILPGGQGAIKHLSDFAVKGPQAVVNPALQRLLEEMHQAKKPIGAISQAPIAVVQALGSAHPSVTTGTDAGTATAIERMGGRHQVCQTHQIHQDRQNRIVTTPGHMTGSGLAQVAAGIDKLVAAVLAMVEGSP